MSRPIDLPPAERFAHGSRARYVAGCRCGDCRGANALAYRERQALKRERVAEVVANAATPELKVFFRTRRDGSRYEVRGRACPGANGEPCVASGAWLRGQGAVCARCVERVTVWGGMVDAARARAHLIALQRAGLGYKQVAAAASVGNSIVQGVRRGSVRQIRATTERRILAVDEGAMGDAALVDAAETWRLLGEVKQRGLTDVEVARGMGYRWLPGILSQPRGADVRRLCTRRTAAKVERLWRRVVREGWRPTSGLSEPSGSTYRLIARLLRDFKQATRVGLFDYHFHERRPPRRVLVSTAARVREVYDRIMAAREDEPLTDGWQHQGASPFAAFGDPVEGKFSGAHVERRASKAARRREQAELRALARSASQSALRRLR
jgi:hypothetical protein